MLFCLPCIHVDTDFRYQTQCSCFVDTVDLGQIHAANPEGLFSNRKFRLIASLLFDLPRRLEFCHLLALGSVPPRGTRCHTATIQSPCRPASQLGAEQPAMCPPSAIPNCHLWKKGSGCDRSRRTPRFPFRDVPSRSRSLTSGSPLL